jgi:capsular polysaccharide transport system permease protein
MEVIAADPQVSAGFFRGAHPLRRGTRRPDEPALSAKTRWPARRKLRGCRTARSEAQERVLDLQEQRGVLSTEAEVSTVFGQIQNFELQLAGGTPAPR